MNNIINTNTDVNLQFYLIKQIGELSQKIRSTGSYIQNDFNMLISDGQLKTKQQLIDSINDMTTEANNCMLEYTNLIKQIQQLMLHYVDKLEN